MSTVAAVVGWTVAVAVGGWFLLVVGFRLSDAWQIFCLEREVKREMEKLARLRKELDEFRATCHELAITNAHLRAQDAEVVERN